MDSERLVESRFVRDGDELTICGHRISLNDIGRIVVVGAGKAGAGMAVAVERVLGDEIVAEKVSGWVNVPADCLRATRAIHLHAARPAGHNEPTQAGVNGAIEILNHVRELGPNDLCLVLLSGGGSALLPAPVAEISLSDKQAVTRFLMHAGATIDELNCVRKQLSRIKGGRLAEACGAATMIVLIISDVIGDPLDVIASGPTVPDMSTSVDALAVLKKYDTDGDGIPASVTNFLRSAQERVAVVAAQRSPQRTERTVHNHVIGNNTVALTAATAKANELGYRTVSLSSDHAGVAADVGRELAERAISIRDENEQQPVCVLSGGEPVVHLVPTDEPRKGGRNQELVLAGLERMWSDGMRRIVLLSGGTDGEDGPTDAAGAFADADVLASAQSQSLSPADFLKINNSYPFFEETGGLLITGPTHTNVMDVRVALIGT